MAEWAHVAEADEEDSEGRFVLTGRFTVTVDGDRVARDLPAESAVALARERCDRVCVEVERKRYTAGSRPIPDHPAWPPPGLSLGRRRPRGEEWLDRPDDAPLVAWAVEAELPAPPSEGLRPAADRLAAAAATALREGGARDVDVDASAIDAALADFRARWEAAGRPDDFGWTSYGRDAYVLTAVLDAPTHRAAEASARRLIEAAAEGGARLTVRARPPGWRPRYFGSVA